MALSVLQLYEHCRDMAFCLGCSTLKTEKDIKAFRAEMEKIKHTIGTCPALDSAIGALD